MNKPSIIETVVLCLALVFIPLITRAALSDDSKFIEGIVKIVSDGTITLTAKSPDGIGGSDVVIKSVPATKYNDLNSADLKEGDKIRVEYHEAQDIKTADSIAKVQP